MEHPEDERNPYEAPRSDGLGTGPGRRPGRGKTPWLGWTLVFAANLFVPLFFGWEITSEKARVGMAVALAVLWAAGWRVCADARGARRPLIVGGLVVALTQVLPVLQTVAGIVALFLVDFLGCGAGGEYKGGPPHVDTVLGGFVATFVTGFLLVAAAVIAGLLIRATTLARWWGQGAAPDEIGPDGMAAQVPPPVA